MAALVGDPAPGVVAGRYRLHHVIGTGGVAVVHEATDTRLDRRVAVKLLREPAADATARARFVSEARLLARLSHPGLARVLDAGIEDARPYLVLELVRGPNLAEALEAGLTPARAAEIGAAVATALAHVHAAGIVHRDVKPGNVLLAEDGTAKLADFGIARLVDDTQHHTRTGTLVGTVAYLAPEQVAGEPVTTAVDVYSWGLVLLEALTGERAYVGGSVESALARLSRAPAVPATLPAAWRSLLLAMTSRDPARRPTAEQVAHRLRRIDVATATRSAHSPLSPSPRLVMAALVAAFALILTVAAWPALSARSGGQPAAAAHRGAVDTVPTAEPTAEPAAATPVAQGAPVPSTPASAQPQARAKQHGARHHPAKHKHKHKQKHKQKHKNKHRD